MGARTDIQWCDHTMNFWWGCDEVSPGCDHCYARTIMTAHGQDFDTVKRTAPSTWKQAATWERTAVREGRSAKVFSCSMGDFFHPDADPWRAEAWDTIRGTPHLTWQLLTKRPNRIAGQLPPDWGERGYPNVWLGVSVENATYTYRLDQLAALPAAVRFVSYEPALAPVDFTPWLQAGTLHWVLIGGESGRGEAPRPFDLDWARRTIDACRRCGATPFVKQLGSVWARATRTDRQDWHGGEPALWPADLRIREFPAVAGGAS